MKAKKIIIFILAFAMLFLSGCWDYYDFNELALVSAFGVDFDKDTKEITVTVQDNITGSVSASKETNVGSKDKQTSGGAIKAKGRSIADAISKIQEVRQKALFFGYINVFILGEEAAKNIMKEVVWYSDRSPTVRNTAYIAVTEGKAEDVLSTMDPNVTVTIGASIREMIKTSVSSGSAYPVSIEDFAEALSIKGIEPAAPRAVVISTKKAKNDTLPDKKDDPIRIVTLDEGYHYINGMAAFRKDKFAGWLDEKESKGLGWITNKQMKIYENVQTVSSEVNRTLIFHVSKSKGKIKAELENGKPAFTVNVYAESDLRKYADNMEPELTPEVISKMEEKLAENIKAEIDAAIKRCQKDLKTDVFGFGFSFFRKFPGMWHKEYEQKWDDLFPDVRINVNVKTKIINTGTAIKTLVK